MAEKLDDTLTKKETLRRKVDSYDSTGLTDEAVSKSPKDVLTLGRVIVRQLELEDRGTVLERWLAHHLAEVIAEADRTVGPSKAAAETRAVDLILKLWTHRRALPEPVDPLGGYRNAVAVLGRLTAEANPWRNFQHSNIYEELLQETFAILSRIVLAGLLLTQISRPRPITAEELEGLEEEEIFLRSKLEEWMSFFSRSQSGGEIDTEVVDSDIAEPVEDTAKPERPDSPDNAVRTQDGQVPQDAAGFHSTIVENLERMQENLGALLDRWRGTTPGQFESDDVDESDER